MGSKSYSKGISWFDDCRIPFVDDNDKGVFNKNSEGINRQKNSNVMETYMNNSFIIGNHKIDDTRQQGRFPANILVSNDMLNDGIKPNKGHRSKSKVSGYGEFGGGKSEYHGIGEYMNVDSTSRYYDIDKWFNNLIDV